MAVVAYVRTSAAKACVKNVAVQPSASTAATGGCVGNAAARATALMARRRVCAKNVEVERFASTIVAAAGARNVGTRACACTRCSAAPASNVRSSRRLSLSPRDPHQGMQLAPQQQQPAAQRQEALQDLQAASRKWARQHLLLARSSQLGLLPFQS